MKNFVISQNREAKYAKINEVLKTHLKRDIENYKILDIGTGNGQIADLFAKQNFTYSVDLLDQRANKNTSVVFKKITSSTLPFSDQSFDVVISNHVIEHVKDQECHIEEINRVLNKNGVCYLATPNRLFIWECHYRIFFLHYLPLEIFNKFLRRNKTFKGDLYLINYFKLKSILTKKFLTTEYTHHIIKNPEKFNFKIPIISRFPLRLLKILNFLSQTNIFILSKKIRR